jgi:hypothetical protein
VTVGVKEVRAFSKERFLALSRTITIISFIPSINICQKRSWLRNLKTRGGSDKPISSRIQGPAGLQTHHDST